MKAHLFYLKRNRNIYAFTDDKKLAESFIKERDMNEFIHKEVKLDDKSDYYNLVKDFSTELRLGKRHVRTYNEDFSEEILNLTLTSMEDLMIFKYEDQIFDLLGRDTIRIDTFFNDNILKLLEEIHYFEAYMWDKGNSSDTAYSGFEMYMNKYHEDTGFANVEADQLQILLYFCGNTFKGIK